MESIIYTNVNGYLIPNLTWQMVWVSSKRLSEEPSKLNLSGDAFAGHDWRASLEVDKAAREREEVILKQLERKRTIAG